MASKSGGNARKINRNIKWCQNYRSLGTRERNKQRRLIRHLKRYTHDKVATKALVTLRG